MEVMQYKLGSIDIQQYLKLHSHQLQMFLYLHHVGRKIYRWMEKEKL